LPDFRELDEDGAMNIAKILEERAAESGGSTAYTFLNPANEESITYASLDVAARRISLGLQSLVAPGERVILLYPPGLSFITGLFACFYAGVIAVPAYPPTTGRSQRNLKRLRGIILDAQPRVALCNSGVYTAAKRLFQEAPELASLHWFNTDEMSLNTSIPAGSRFPDEKTPAFLQYTSGSTADPKGVIISHSNLMHNLELIRRAFGHSLDSRGVIWLPPYHDMGLIGGILQPLYVGFPVTLMAPTVFLQKPYAWLQAISDTSATTSGGPNSAYDLCVERVTEEQKATLNLRSWSVAFSGAEPVRSKTMAMFSDAFRSCGFRRDAFLPCYGLAEATLIVTGFHARRGSEVTAVTVESESMKVGCGAADDSMELQIVDPKTKIQVEAGTVGEIWVSGPSVACGYWGKPELARKTFGAMLKYRSASGPYLRTGDLGFLKESQLHVTGRIKDLIIIRGLNYYPQDIESTAGDSHPAVRGGMGAAFAVETEGEERLVVAQEVNRHYKSQEPVSAIIAKIRQAVAREHELSANAVVLVAPGRLPKTSSGKVQRHVCRDLFLKNEFDALATEIFSGTPSARNDDLKLEALENLPVEQRLAAIDRYLRSLVSAILKVDTVSLSGRFDLYKAGLDSLMLLDFQHRVMRDTGVELPYEVLYEMHDITELASEICLQLERRTTVLATAAPLDRRDGAFSLSYNQRALWFLHELAPEDSAYNIVAAARLTGELDREALLEAFRLLCDRHAVLRMRFAEENGQPIQAAKSEGNSAVTFKDASNWSEDAMDHQLADIANAPFDLRNESPTRIHLLKRGARDHLLIWVTHHIVSDFWSFGILFAELEALYLAAAEGRSLQLEPVKATYCDYVQWQSELLQSPRCAQLRNFWRDRITSILPLALPGRRNIANAKPAGATHDLNLPGDLRASPRELAAKAGLTLNELLLAAFEVLLHRLTGAERTVLGIPGSGRSKPGFRDMVGYCVNPLLIEADFGDCEPFLAFCRRVKCSVREAIAHQDYPMLLVFQEAISRGGRDLPSGVQVFFSFHDAGRLGRAAEFLFPEDSGKIDWGSLTLRPFSIRIGAAQFELAVRVFDSRDQLRVSWQYREDLFSPLAIEQMAEHWIELLRHIVQEPERPISELRLLTEAERAKLLNGRTDERVLPRCMHELFDDQVQRSASIVAVVCESQRLTYLELKNRADEIAARLKQAGVGPESRVGLVMEPSPDLIIGIFGIWKAGGAYVPIDPAWPRDRMHFIFEDSRVAAVLTQSKFLDRFDAAKIPVISTEARNGAAAQDVHLGYARSCPENAAYLIYTSGSSGQPKGVLVEHRSLVGYSLAVIDRFEYSSGWNYVTLASVATDLGNTVLFPALLVGGTLHLISPERANHPKSLGEYFQREQIDVLKIVPSHLNALQAGANSNPIMPRRHLILGGEVSRADWVKQLQAAYPDCVIHNHYGPTETTIGVLTHATNGKLSSLGSSSLPLGRPLCNARVFVLDQHLEPVPVGAPGNLYVGGAALARGYHKRPDLTAAAFVPDPFGEAGSRLYWTGDLARYLPDGSVEFLGRKDHQVKVRGFRIEIGEIEARLSEIPRVQECVVLVREDEPGNKIIVAYVVTDRSSCIGAIDLKQALQKTLPEYMVPSVFVPMPALPRMANGKIDRVALPAPDRSRSPSVRDESRSPVEELLCGLWREVLKIETVGVNDDFFELGGHSLLGMQMMSQVRDLFQVELMLKELFTVPTIAALARRVEEARGNGSALLPLERTHRNGALPLAYAQERLWILDQLESGNVAYNMPGAIRIRGELSSSVLERVLGEIVRRHEILRTRFEAAKDGPVQVIEPDFALEVGWEDLEESGDDREAKLKHLLEREAAYKFDLKRGPLIRATLVRLTASEHVLLLTFHHIVFDGWSTGVLIREFVRLYEAFSSGRSSPLRELPIQYVDYAAWQKNWLEGAIMQGQLRYWTDQLRGVEPLELPTDRPRPVGQSYRGAAEVFQLDTELLAGLKALSRDQGVTLFMVLAAGLKVLLARYCGQQDVAIGTPITNRSRKETEELIGFFVNTLVLRTDLSGDPEFVELLRREREVTLGAYAHQEVPFDRVVQELRPERDARRSPLFQVMLVLQNTPREALRIPGLEFEPMRSEQKTSKFDLVLTVNETGAGADVKLDYSTDLFDRQTIERMVRHWQNLLRDIAANPRRRLSELDMLTPQEKKQVLAEWNDTRIDGSTDRCIYQLFEEQVARTPDAVAVVSQDGQWTYRQLNSRANELGRRLQNLGVDRDKRVGICLERSPEMIAAVMAVLKAGGAYVPLDPMYPQERLAFMASDARLSLVLTQLRFAKELAAGAAQLLSVDQNLSQTAELTDNFASLAGPENLIYVIYTSGSTGQPKGAGVYHGGFVNLMNWFIREFCITANDKVLLATSLSFDLTQKNLYATLVRGGELHLCPSGLFDPVVVGDWIQRHRITLLNCTPSAFYALLEHTSEGKWRELVSLRRVFLGGEPISIPRVQSWLRSANCHAEIVNTYGPTECTDISCFHTIDAARLETYDVVPIGRPISNVQTFLLDEWLTPCPAGVIGEIYVGGCGVGAGYLNDPWLTAEKFVPCPFNTERGGRLYRTGDLGRYSCDGNLEYVGRTDHQVKVRGFRIELGEIESCLDQYESVLESVVVTHGDREGNRRLAAYVVSRDSLVTSASELRNYLATKLPDYMIPAAFTMMRTLPLTPSGKVDRNRLPIPDWDAGCRTEYVAPRTPIEETLVKMWEDVLGQERIGIHDNFFHIGGNSLLMARITTRIRSELKVEVAMTKFFQKPTVAWVAEVIVRHRAEESNAGEISALLDQLESLSDKEVEERLAKIGEVGNPGRKGG
jgi:amino acid adenylation domain-containing protein